MPVSISSLALQFLCIFALLNIAYSEPNYSPLRAPALPLAVRSPYTNAWASSSSNGTSAVFWQGSELGWEGIITVDNISYEYLGNDLKLLPPLKNIQYAYQTDVTYDSQWSNFTIKAGPVVLTAAFFSPVIAQDLCRTSIPLSYLQTSFKSLDGKEHDVKLYSDVNGRWVDANGDSTIQWSLETICLDCRDEDSVIVRPPSRNLSSWIVELETGTTFGEISDSARWSTLAYTSDAGKASDFSWESGYSLDLRYNYLNGHPLSRESDPSFRTSSDREPVFAFTHHFPSAKSGIVLYTVGNIQQPVVQYLSSSGLARLEPWWTTCYDDYQRMIDWHYADFATAAVKGAAFERQLRSDVAQYYQNNTAVIYNHGAYHDSTSANGTDQFGQLYTFNADDGHGYLDPSTYTGLAVPDVSEAESYYAIVALSARQIMGAYVLTVPPPVINNASSTVNQSEPFMFQKEISSNGNMNTVDVLFPALPFFLYVNPQLLKYALNPLYLYQDSGFYPNAYSIHDIGAAFPNATGHLAGDDEAMPVEECGDMLIMSYAYYKFTGDLDFLRAHYARLVQWAEFLNDYSLIPESQLSTDDFAGTLANQTNLAIKGIVGLKVISLICDLVGETETGKYYSARASSYVSQWQTLAIDPSGKHTVLAYQFRSSWGLLYNIFPDKLLGLGLIPDEIYEMQSAFYPTVSQLFGVPLDSRHSYTKSDWEMWTAATCEPETRRLFVNAIAFWLNNTSTSLAFTDLYDTVGTGGWPDVAKFIARPVVGGHFSLLALLKAGQDSDNVLKYEQSNATLVFTDNNAGYLTTTASDDSAIITAISTLTAASASFVGTFSSDSEPPTVTWSGSRVTTLTVAG